MEITGWESLETNNHTVLVGKKTEMLVLVDPKELFGTNNPGLSVYAKDIMDHLDEGIDCHLCGQHCQIYRYSLAPAHIMALEFLAKHVSLDLPYLQWSKQIPRMLNKNASETAYNICQHSGLAVKRGKSTIKFPDFFHRINDKDAGMSKFLKLLWDALQDEINSVYRPEQYSDYTPEKWAKIKDEMEKENSKPAKIAQIIPGSDHTDKKYRQHTGKKETSGLWRPSQMAKEFLDGTLMVPESSFTFNRHLIGFSRRLINISEMRSRKGYRDIFDPASKLSDTFKIQEQEVSAAQVAPIIQ